MVDTKEEACKLDIVDRAGRVYGVADDLELPFANVPSKLNSLLVSYSSAAPWKPEGGTYAPGAELAGAGAGA